MYIHIGIQVPEDVREGLETSGTGVRGYCEPPDMGAAGSTLSS